MIQFVIKQRFQVDKDKEKNIHYFWLCIQLLHRSRCSWHISFVILAKEKVVVKNVVKSRDCSIPKWRPPLISDMFQVLIDICNQPFVRHTVCRIRNTTRHSLTLEFKWYHLIPLKLSNWCHRSILLSRN